MENLLKYADLQCVTKNKYGGGGLGSNAVGSNQSRSWTDEGCRIYRNPNVTGSLNGSGVGNWGGWRIAFTTTNTPKSVLVKGHTYLFFCNVRGKSDSQGTNCGWAFNWGWDGDSALIPRPTTLYKDMNIPIGNDINKTLSWAFKIEDDIDKVCEKAFTSGWVVGNTYQSYKHLHVGYQYTTTGSVGTDVYLSNFNMYDITDYASKISFNKNGVVDALTINCLVDAFSMNKYGLLSADDIIED